MRNLVKTKKALVCIWVFFGILFFGLGLFHLYASTKSISHFPDIKVIPHDVHVEFIGPLSITNVNKAFEDFTRKLNDYIDDVNRSSILQNLTAFIGYAFASLTAFFSAWLSRRETETQPKGID